MARLPYLDAEDVAEADRDLFARPINLARLLAHSPGMARAMGGVGGQIRRASKLDPRLCEIAILTVGWEARAPYEWSHHVKIGRDRGVTEQDLQAIVGKAEPADPVAALVMQGAREVHAGPGMSEAALNALKPHFDNETLVDLVFTMAFYCGVVRLLDSFAIDVEEKYQPYLEEFPFPA